MMLAVPAVASAAFPHVVTPGESLYSVAAADGLSVDQLAAANGVAPDAQLVAGTTVMIPPQASGGVGASTGSTAVAASAGSTSDTGSTASAGSSSGAYVVQRGDTLSGIAARSGTTISELAAANGLDQNAPLLAGAVLRVTGSGATASAVSQSASADTQPVGAAAEGSSGGPPYPTPEIVSAPQVGSIASANGVSPSLADAIGWQESGFNNDLVSSADARGVMQILPGTWDWIQRTLTPSAPLAPASAADNVRGGVLLLHSLLNSTGGDPALAAAGYYQGLSSVRRHGLFVSTQQYVNSVMALRQRFGGG
jgi:N-acetylmuramoyl-L-alanine amidase